MDYNRVVKDLNGLTKEQFLEKLEQDFTVEPYLGEGPCSPPQKHSFGMYLDGQWYLLRAKEGSFDANDPVAQLDVSILQENLLQPHFGHWRPRAPISASISSAECAAWASWSAASKRV